MPRVSLGFSVRVSWKTVLLVLVVSSAIVAKRWEQLKHEVSQVIEAGK